MDAAFPLPDFAALTAAADDPDTDLQDVLDNLAGDLTAAIPSFIGLTITITVDGHAVTVSTVEGDQIAAAGSSMLLPLAVVAGTEPTSAVAFYAYNPGAFVDLAADARHAFGLDGEVVLDGHLRAAPPGIRRGLSGLDEITVVNRALGALIEAGYPPEEARAELERRAGNQRHLAQAADDVLSESSQGDSPRAPR